MEKLTKKNVIEMMMKEEVIASNEIYMNYLINEKRILDNKKGKSAKETDLDNQLKELIYDELLEINKAVTISDLMAQSENISNFTYELSGETKKLTNQKIKAVLKKLIADEKVVNIKDKKASLFMVK